MEIRRWNRYGHDRLYFRDDAGTQVGWWDLATATAHEVAPGWLERLTAEATAWTARQRSAPPPRPAPRTLEPVPPPVPVTDIAFTLPGSQLFAHAAAEGPGSSWQKGIEGENVVADCLYAARQANPYWSFLNSVAVSETADIDHVLMGPAGVFTINAKHHSNANVWVGGDTIMVNGQRQPYVRNARAEAKKAERFLCNACNFDVAVRPVIVIVGRGRLQIKAPPEDVLVLHHSRLTRFILELTPTLHPDTLNRILDTARRSDTWQRPKPRRAAR